ncbi:MAG: hypothetical protein Q3984_03605 [Eubacteriales bacterium]|nr:hypothetical protein [Eubacteriales bacterium]
MGIYLPNMEMPRKGQMLVIFPDGTSYVCFNGMRERLTQTTAVPVPPHGKLGDLDALIAVYERQIERHKEQAEKAAVKGTGYTNDMYIIDRGRDIISALKAAPIIIEAEEVE